MRKRRVGWLALAVSVTAQALEAPPVATAPDVVVTATRDEAREFDLPVTVDSVDVPVIREANAMVNLSEALNRVPGVLVQNRQNYAQDLQITSRGFGARSAFGVRGVRLVADGIPATMPDGQGQSATFSLGSASRIEVLRGPFAALYGNASGAYIESFTEDGPEQPAVRSTLSLGSYDSRRLGIVAGGSSERLNYVLDASRFETDGYRRHSAARRTQLNARLRTELASGGSLTAVFNALDQPDTQDPLGLRRNQMEADPRQADPVALLFDTRKSIDHRQAGLTFKQPLGNGDVLHIAGYAGTRDVQQFLAIPLAVQMQATSGGGVVDLDRRFGGLNVRYTTRRPTETGEIKLTGGVEYERMEEHRRGYLNVFGAQGALKRDQDDQVSSADVFVIGEWSIGKRWTLTGGARYSRVQFESNDAFIVPGNPDDSGSVHYSGDSIAFGALYKLTDQVHVYANAGTGFETPTLTELAYRPDGSSGLNFALQPSQSRQLEVGLKANLRTGQRLRATAFFADTEDEIVVNSAAGGRTTYKNAGRTRRQGVEASWEAVFANGFEAYVAWTWIDAYYRDGFSSGSPPERIPAGNRLPGVPKSVLYADLVWREAASGFYAGLEARRVGKLPVDDLNSEFADRYSVLSARIGFEQRAARWRLKEFVRFDNVTDERYAGSIIVGDSNRRFYEPAPGRNYLVGVETSMVF